VRLILIRHGQTPANTAGLLETAAPGSPLDATGLAQAASLPGRLAGERVAALFCSPLTRTRQTIAPLAGALGLTPLALPGLREVGAGRLEGRGDDDAQDLYCDAVFRWSGPGPYRAVPCGEDRDGFMARYDAAVAVIAGIVASGGGAAVLTSHAAAIRAWAGSRARNLDEDFIVASQVGNTAIVLMEGSPADGWTALSWAGEACPV
jgi:probable phosphoglycerate mutase